MMPWFSMQTCFSMQNEKMKHLYELRDFEAIALMFHLIDHFPKYMVKSEFGPYVSINPRELSILMGIKKSRLISIIVKLHMNETITLLQVERKNSETVGLSPFERPVSGQSDYAVELQKRLTNKQLNGQIGTPTRFSASNLALRYCEPMRQMIENTRYFSSLHYRDNNKRKEIQAPCGAANFFSESKSPGTGTVKNVMSCFQKSKADEAWEAAKASMPKLNIVPIDND